MSLKMKKHLARAGTAVTFLGLSAAARADTGVDAITALGITGATYITAAFALAVIMTTGFWGIRLMKKAARAAA